MRRTLVLMTVAVLLGGCGADDSEPGLDDSISGTWVTRKGVYVTFDPDGTYTAGGEVGSASKESGVWLVDGKVLTKTADAASPYCAGVTGTDESELLDGGDVLESTVIDDGCNKRVSDFVYLTRYDDDADS